VIADEAVVIVLVVMIVKLLAVSLAIVLNVRG